MNYTVQYVSRSGSFGMPYGDDIEHASNKNQIANMLEAWEHEHKSMGSDESDASMLVWNGKLADVTDCYPDYEVKRGPRGGIIWSIC